MQLATRLREGAAVAGVAGLTTRGGDGPPAPVLDCTPLTTRPERGDLPEILGHRAAHMSASRGCLGRCHYCGPAALHTLERAEGKRAGIARETLNEAGVGGVRRRTVADVCEEMAYLWHERDVRYFYFVDEHMLPYREPEALDYLRDFRAGLARYNLGKFGLGTMLRADRLTPAIAKAFAEVGLVRAFVGLELTNAEDGRTFARRAPGREELDLLRTFARLGVATASNIMLVHPYATNESLAQSIDFLARIPEGLFEATQMQVYHGTRLHERLMAEGRLVGNPLRYGYYFEDPIVQRFAEIFSRLRGEAFWNYSLAYRTHDAHLALALAARLGRAASPRLQDELRTARRAINALYIEAYRRALGLASDGVGFAGAAGFIAEMKLRSEALEVGLGDVEPLDAAGQRPFVRCTCSGGVVLRARRPRRCGVARPRGCCHRCSGGRHR